MKLTYSLAALAAACVLAGCDQSKQAGKPASEPSADINAPPAQEQREEVVKKDINVPPPALQREIVKTEVKEAVDATKTYLTASRDQFVASAQQKLTEMDQKITELGDTIATLNENAFANETLNSLREMRSRLDPLFEELTKSSTEAWDDTKKAFESALAELEQAYLDAKTSYGS